MSLAVAAPLALSSPRGRGVLLATVLASGMAFLDGTVVNVALPTIGRELGASTSGLQWTVDAYLVTLTALLLLGGSLGDALGRRQIFLAGTLAFAATSALCGLAPTISTLCAARALQGVAAALVVPGSLAILKSSFRREDQDAAIGAWTGLSGVTTAAGPLVGGWLVQAVSWRAIFFVNLPLALATLWSAYRCVPGTSPERRRLDWGGAALAAVALSALAYALIEGPAHRPAAVAGSAGLAAVAAGGFAVLERRSAAPMLPPGLFRSRQFTGANLTTLAVYFALSAALFLLVLGLQQGLGYTPLGSSLVLLPVTLIMLALSPVAGRLAHAVGYRAPMTVGPALAALGLAAVALGVRPGRSPAPIVAGMSLFAVGLALTVTPLTAAAMDSVSEAEAGVASGVNNAVARLAGLLGVAVLPGLVGVAAHASGEALLRAVRTGLLASAALCLAGGVAAWTVLSPSSRTRP